MTLMMREGGREAVGQKIIVGLQHRHSLVLPFGLPNFQFTQSYSIVFIVFFRSLEGYACAIICIFLIFRFLDLMVFADTWRNIFYGFFNILFLLFDSQTVPFRSK